MKKLLWITLTGIFSISLQAQTPTKINYKQLWEKVAEYERRSLPKSAQEEVDRILRQAVADSNSPQIIKAIIHQGKYDLAIDSQNDTTILVNFRQMLEKSQDMVEQSVLNSILGELYLQYYQRHSWVVSQRTPVNSFVPADMQEWSKNIFFDKIVQHLNASIQARAQLEQTPVAAYAPVVYLGDDSRDFYPSMYDFLALRAIRLFAGIGEELDMSRSLAAKNITQQSLFVPADEFVTLNFAPDAKDYNLWVPETYRKLLLSLKERKLDNSVLLTELEKLDYLSRFHEAYNAYALSSLQKMKDRYNNLPISVEIVNKMADIYNHAGSETIDKQQLQKTAELYNLLKETIDKFPQYERISLLQNQLIQLTYPTFQVQGGNTFASKSPKTLKIKHRNLKSAKAKLYRLDSAQHAFFNEYDYRKSANEKKTFLQEMEIPLPDYPPYQSVETEITFDLSEYGAYKVDFKTDPTIQQDANSSFYFSVSDLATFSRRTDSGLFEAFVVDRKSGNPATSARIDFYRLSANGHNTALQLSKSIPVNEEGLVAYAPEEKQTGDFYFQVVAGKDNGAVLNRLYLYHNYTGYTVDNEKEQETTHVFTDRTLYRPGQTVYFKAIASKTQKENSQAITQKSVRVVLFDANYQEVSKKTLVTNEFGSVSGEFFLPQGLLTGDFTIKAGEGEARFRVEEYKRPTFGITFDKVAKTYRFGEATTVAGQAENFSGVKLQNTHVDYSITRRHPWWHWGASPSEHFTSGSVSTDENGKFEISFIPAKPDDAQHKHAVYLFQVEVTVTDLNGESQTNTYSVPVGDVSMTLSVDIPDRVEKNTPENILISAKNLDGNDISTSGTYRLFSLNEQDSLKNRVLESAFETGQQPQLREMLKKLPSGKYRIDLQAEDDKGNEITAGQDFILFSYADKRPPIETPSWFVVKNSVFSPSKPAEIILGSTSKNHVLYELWQGTKRIERKWITINNENHLFSIPYKTEHKEGLTLILSFMKDQKFYTQQVELSAEQERTDLVIKLDVFRDKIRPGAHEEWKLSVKDASGNSVLAEALVSMYDFSLDRIYAAPAWSLNFARLGYRRSASWFQEDNSLSLRFFNAPIFRPYHEIRPFLFDSFNWYDFSLHYSPRILMRGAKSLQNSRFSEDAVIAYGVAQPESLQLVADMSVEKKNAVAENEMIPSPPQSDTPINIRRNFSETAFFYPQLHTDDKGEIHIAFTVPENNTRWRFRVLAHDEKLRSGYHQTFAVSQKELMVTPNMPRFLRCGDKTAISAKISNLSEEAITGNVRLEFFDPPTNRALITIDLPDKTKSFSLSAGASADVSWMFDVPEGIDILGVRIVAQSKDFSDGEQHALAVLPNRMLVTESVRMDVSGTQTKEFIMDRLVNQKSGTSKNYRLTLEFTSNPAWYAIQALPVLSAPDSDNSVSWFAAYFANTLGIHIGETYPKVSAMVEAWKKQGGDSETLLSDLEKNQELKNVLLEETPWVLEAQNETEQKQKLSLLFDLNRSKNLQSQTLRKLAELQTPEGGWSWFKGFYPSRSITQYLLYGFHQLKETSAAEITDEVRSMQAKAISFIDDKTLEHFQNLKRHDKNWRNIQTISTSDLEYLYVRSAYPQYPVSADVKEMTDFYTSKIEKYWTQYGLYARSLIAVVMHRNGKNSVVQAILKSFREHATVSEEMGMYWANNSANVFISQSAVVTHTFIMDAFRLGGSGTAETDNMKRWLLKQKQTLQWESTHATVSAVYALLSRGNDWFSDENKTTVNVGGNVLKPENRELGSEYFSKTWSQTEITPQMGQVKIENQGNAPAWGALYWQYYEDSDKISKTDTSLDIEKMLFKEETDTSGQKLTPITETNPLQVGDKVTVRLTLRTDRDMEFVHLKDMRAAAFEPMEQLSGTKWNNSILYYQTSKDASTNFYFDALPRGTYVFEYRVYVTGAGSYSNGMATVQCMYAPEFTSHTSGIRVEVK